MSDYQWKPELAQPHRSRKQRPGWQKVIVLAVVGFAVLIGGMLALGALSSGSDAPRTPTVDKYSMVEAQIDCERAVEARLVSPGTAEFEHTATTPKGAGWDVRGYVDSENRMGGTMRSVFGCNATEASVVVSELMQLN